MCVCVWGGRGVGVTGCPGFGLAPDTVTEDAYLFPISCSLPPRTSVNV